MKSEIKVYDRGNGEIQRVQVVSWEEWSKLDFLYLKQESAEQQKKALQCFRDIYQNYLVPVMPAMFPQMVMFALPEDEDMQKLLMECASDSMKNGCYESKKYGSVSDPLIIASILLQEGVKLKKEKPTFANQQVERLYRELERRGCVYIIAGKLPKTKVIPVGRFAGYLSQTEVNAKMKVNAHFFIMDSFDCATIYDQIGTPFGLCIKDGVIENPPMYNREAFLVEKDGNSHIAHKDIFELAIEIQGTTYVSGENATIYTRPKYTKAPSDKRVKAVIVGRKVVAVKDGGSIPVPASGFVLSIKEGSVAPGDEVIYHGMPDVQFGVQVGNSIIRDGVKTESFISQFYDIYKLQPVPYPPSLYPMDFEKARAARMAIGASAEGNPVLFWTEGKGKLEYVEGRDSTGASLTEMAEIAADLGLKNAVNLDGGGSAQILLDNERALHISDRNKEDNSDAERLVPLGLIVR